MASVNWALKQINTLYLSPNNGFNDKNKFKIILALSVLIKYNKKLKINTITKQQIFLFIFW